LIKGKLSCEEMTAPHAEERKSWHDFLKLGITSYNTLMKGEDT
jgi:hypothetical protein